IAEVSHPTAASSAAQAATRPCPVNGPRGARFSGWAEPRVHSRPFSQTLAVLAFLSASPPVLLSALQCADGSAPPCQASAPPPNSVAVLYFDNLSADTGMRTSQRGSLRNSSHGSGNCRGSR